MQLHKKLVLNTKTMTEPPLLNLFLGLRDAGLPLGIDQYYLAEEALLQSIEAGLNIADKEAVARLCQSVWVKSRQQQRLFDQCWNEIISHPPRLSKSSIIEPSNSKQRTPPKSSLVEKTKPIKETNKPGNQTEKEDESFIPASSDGAVVTSG